MENKITIDLSGPQGGATYLLITVKDLSEKLGLNWDSIYKEIENKDYNNLKSIWKYDLNITTTGPVSVEQVYPKNWKSWEELNDALPITKRMFYNEETGGLVSYGRAKQLGII